MSREAARVSLEKSTLRVELGRQSALLTGVGRVFFANVLGFEPATDFPGYITQVEAPSLKLLADVIDYLHDRRAKVDLNEQAKLACQQMKNASDNLESALTAGREIKSNPPTEIETPALKRPLKAYQVAAVAHAVKLTNSANFSVPGSGKTSVTLAAFAILRSRKEVDKIVVVGPRASFMPWEDEFRACFRRKPRGIRISGGRHLRMRLYRQADSKELVLLTYQMASNDADQLIALLQRNKVLLILDESHNVKRFEGGKWADVLIKVGPHATRRMILTGTPAPNSVADLWSQMTFLWPNPQVLGSRDQFKYRLADGDETVLAGIRKQISPLYWRTTKAELALPKPRFKRIRLNMRPYQRAIYTALAAKVLADVVKAPTERAKLRIWRRARMVRLLQAASNPALLTQESVEFRVPPLSAAGLPVDQLIQNYSDYETPVKLDFAMRLTRRLVGLGRKVLVWTAFVNNIRALERALVDLRPRVVYGDVPPDDNENLEFNRERMIREFRTSPKYQVLIANPSACAESVSLHKVCLNAIYLDRTFNCAHYMQSMDRIHRVGLEPDDHVYYHILQSADTIDDIIDDRLNEKQTLMFKLLNEDFSVVNMDYSADAFSEEPDEDRDFSALVEYLRRQVHSQDCDDR